MQDCQIAYSTSRRPIMQAIRIVHLFSGTIGLIVSTIFIAVLCSRSSRNIHVNMRLSLISMTVAAWVACFQLSFIASYNLINLLSNDEPCSALTNAYWCATARYPIVLAIYSTLIAIIVIAIERTIATIKYRTYEVHGSRCVAISLISAQWFLSILLASSSTYARTDSGYLHHCSVYISHPKSAVISLSTMSVLEIFTLFFLVLLQHRNEQKQIREFVNNAMHTLTERYQLQENVKIMRVIIPSIAVHTVLSLCGVISMLVFTLLTGPDEYGMSAKFAPFSETVLLVVPLHSVVFPLVAILKNKQLRHATGRVLPWLFPYNKRRNIVELSESSPESGPLTSRFSAQVDKDGDVHFNMLNEMWKK
ncbi:unnamed protein product [Auanema sp. JU1783]|nr:unnamed protein product [Auanema sp. JU1783]